MAMQVQTLSLDRGSLVGPGNKCSRDPSFSSYLNGTEECSVLNLAKKSFNGVADDDGEIGVFSAERYFNEGLGDGKPKVDDKCAIRCPPEPEPEPKLVPHLEIPVRQRIKSGASSVLSGSSWNSQSALLQRSVRNPSVHGDRKLRGRSYLGSFRCKCVCSDKNSVAVDEYESYRENLTGGSNKETLKAGSNQSLPESQCRTAAPGPNKEISSSFTDFYVEDLPVKPRKSLEVFGSPILAKQNKPFSFETAKVLMLSWEDDLPRPTDIVIPKVAYVESDSDASSDLFEIEDFTGRVNPFFSRQISRNRSGSATPTAGYAPSEASIEWSVVTASAADLHSNYEELKPSKNKTANCKTTSTGPNPKHLATNDKPRRRSSSFLGCHSQESVSVVGNAHTACEKMFDMKTLKSQDLPAPVFRSQTEAKMTAPDLPRNMQREISSRPPLAQTHSIRISNIGY